MLFFFYGPSCSGKSTVARMIAGRTKVEVWSGKDYLRLDPQEPEAKRILTERLLAASQRPELGEGSVIHVACEPPETGSAGDRAVTVRFTASPEVLRERIRKRTGGQLPDNVADMIDRQLQQCGNGKAELKFDTSQMHPGIITDAILVYAQSRAALPDRSQKQQ